MFKSELPEPILLTSEPNARKCSNRNSWNAFPYFLRPMLENVQIGAPGTHFVDFWAHCQKILKSGFLEHIVDFCAHCKQMLKSELLEPIFLISGPQCYKILEPEFLEPILSTSNHNARKCSNQSSWNPFCRFLKQGQAILKSEFRD